MHLTTEKDVMHWIHTCHVVFLPPYSLRRHYFVAFGHIVKCPVNLLLNSMTVTVQRSLLRDLKRSTLLLFWDQAQEAIWGKRSWRAESSCNPHPKEWWAHQNTLIPDKMSAYRKQWPLNQLLSLVGDCWLLCVCQRETLDRATLQRERQLIVHLI